MIELLVLDIDGTMTDGGITYDSTGNELKTFSVKDGAGILLAHAAGVQVMICTGRECEAVRRRAADLQIEHLHQNVKDKAAFLADFLARNGLSAAQVAYCGDDYNDLAAMALCGFVACPADAAAAVQARADYIAPVPGGQGAVRAAIEHFLTAEHRLKPAALAAFGAEI